ncbi:MAG: class I SAM-dependent methyltransferase [Pseudomonadota bacterium]
MRRLLLLSGFALLLAACQLQAPRSDEQAAQQALQQAIASPARSSEARARDNWRHPLETLLFFGFRPDMTVVEIWPGGGWYTDILGPALNEKGRLYAAHFPVATNVPYYQKTRTAYEERLRTLPWAARVTPTEFLPQGDLKIAPDGSADLVVTFRNVHNWYMQGGDAATADAFRQFYAALKPGGVLGVVDHRLPEDRPDFEMVASGYMKQSYVTRQAEAAGFRLEASSGINANPRDTADHPKGVWTLPPTLRLGDRDKDKYLAIGESDRMTLKFRKPDQ